MIFRVQGGATGTRDGVPDGSHSVNCLTSMKVDLTLTPMKTPSEGWAIFPPFQSIVQRETSVRELALRISPPIHTSRVCEFPPPKWTGPGPNHKKWTERGQPKKRTGRNPTPNFRLPFLYFVIY